MNNINVGRPTYRTETIEDQKLIIKCYQDNFNKIKAFPKLPINEIKKWQFKRLKWLVKHSYETLPFYHKKYKENNFHPDKFKTFNDFKKIPVVTKEELIEAWPNNLVSKLHNTEFTTRSSGSSGKFVTVAVDKKAPQGMYGLAIGIVLTFDIIVGGALTGASMNPARSFGPAAVSGFWTDHLVYWVGPVFGALVAALVYSNVLMEKKEGKK